LTPTVCQALSFLFVPATRPERFAKAMTSGAGMVILDLEDAVALKDKDSARASMLEGVIAMASHQRERVLVRVNAARTRWHADDLRAVNEAVSLGIAGIMMPKAEEPEDLSAAILALGLRGALVPLIESLRGWDQMAALAQVPRVSRLAFGHLDFQQDLGLRCALDEAELTPIRLGLVMASRRAGLAPPVDGVTVDVQDSRRLAQDADRGHRLGFGAKLCIHPAQLAAVEAAFLPTPHELNWALRVQAQAAEGHAVFQLDGRMVDAPVIALAQRLIDRTQEFKR
jgi:citrate lyase subunit beta/citryl-CoA lyase